MATTVYRGSAVAGFEVRQGSRPSGCPRPMRRSWLRRNRLQNSSGAGPSGPEGFSLALLPARLAPLLSPILPVQFLGSKSPHFFGEASERRPWAIKREDRPAAFA